jgi:hypothetical protein
MRRGIFTEEAAVAVAAADILVVVVNRHWATRLATPVKFMAYPKVRRYDSGPPVLQFFLV